MGVLASLSILKTVSSLSVSTLGQGATLNLTVEGETQVRAFLAGIARRVKDLRPAWKKVDLILRRSVARMFREEGSRFKGGWDPLQPTTQEYRRLKGKVPDHPILVFDGDLRRSLTLAGHSKHIFISKKKYMVFGTKVPYAIFHQSPRSRKLVRSGDRIGKVKLPRRPMVFIDKHDASRIIQAIRVECMKEGKKARRRGK